ncbi:MAG TPA: D-glycerate dehydrogenase [Syntrophorhabdales bacterium]|nr:D-glycerate dehydrogenase [Syntrophorhabdales bacterium]
MAHRRNREKILVTGRIPDDVLRSLRQRFDVEANTQDRPMERERVLRALADKDGLISLVGDIINSELLDRTPRLRMIAQMAVGYDNVDLGAATARGIPVSNTPDVLTDATADLTFALVLALSRRIVELDKLVRRGEFKFWAPMLFLGREVSGKTLGIVGFGRIGQAVAERARGFRMRILYNDLQKIAGEREQELNAEYANLERLLKEADFVSLHVSLNEETRHLISQSELALMKPTACLINAARGPVVDEKALVKALRSNIIAGAGLDVYENEPVLESGLMELENVILLPHVGSATLETRTRMASLAAENLSAGLEGKVPPNLLNPEVLQHRRT